MFKLPLYGSHHQSIQISPLPLSEVVQMTLSVMGTAIVAHLTHHLRQQQFLFAIDKNTATGRSIATHEPLGAVARV